MRTVVSLLTCHSLYHKALQQAPFMKRFTKGQILEYLDSKIYRQAFFSEQIKEFSINWETKNQTAFWIKRVASEVLYYMVCAILTLVL